MRRWVIFTFLVAGAFMMPLGSQFAQTPSRLLHAAQSCQVEPRAFYIEAAATLPDGQAQAVLRLAAHAVHEWPAGEAQSIAISTRNAQRVTLAASCPPDATQAEAIVQRMKMLLGEDADIAVCLTGRSQAPDLAALADEAMRQMEDAPREALREARLVSLTGERAQVALRADAQGVMVFLACPLIPMDY